MVEDELADKLWPLLDGLRARGVARYEAAGICVSFHEPGLDRSMAMVASEYGKYETAIGPDSRPPPDEDLCTCGHPILTDHMPTGCVHGCAIETCGVPAGKAPPDA